MHFGLTEEQQMIVDTVRSFVEHEIYPHEAEVERTGEVDPGVAGRIKRKTIELGFSFYSDSSVTYTGPHVDDVLVAEPGDMP